jgi:transposase-like protein
MERIAPSAELEAEIGALLGEGVGDGERLAALGRLGVRLVLQRAVEEAVPAFLGRARYERAPAARGWRNGTRPRRVQTAEGALAVAGPQVRGTPEPFLSRGLPRTKAAVRTRLLEALVVGASVRGLSDREVESLVAEAGLGPVSESTVSALCREPRDRSRAFQARALHEGPLLVLVLEAVYLPTRPSGAKEGVPVAWGSTTAGQRVPVSVRLGQRERYADWLDLGRDLTRRGLPAPWLVVSDGAPGLLKGGAELWPGADRQRCSVHRLRNVTAKLPRRPGLPDRVKQASWAALDEATAPADGERRLRALVDELTRSFPSAAACLAEDPPARGVHLRSPLRLRRRLRSTNPLERALEEVRRRTKVSGRFPGETSCLSLGWAVLDLVLAASHGLGLTDLDRPHLARLRPEPTALSKVSEDDPTAAAAPRLFQQCPDATSGRPGRANDGRRGAAPAPAGSPTPRRSAPGGAARPRVPYHAS